MKIEEANKVIAEFMFPDVNDRRKRKCFLGEFDYHKSLDGLVPVWEKVSFTVQMYHSSVLGAKFTTPFGNVSQLEDRGLSIQEAAAIATAKAILHSQP